MNEKGSIASPSGSRRKRFSSVSATTLSSAIGALAALIGTISAVWTLFQAQEPGPPTASSTDASLSAFQWEPNSLLPTNERENARLLVIRRNQGGETWITTPGGSSARVSYRQAASMHVSVVPTADSGLPDVLRAVLSREPLASNPHISYSDGDVLCLEISAAAFEISGAPRSCVDLRIQTDPSWAWSLYPKSDTLGEQVIVLTATTETRRATQADSAPAAASTASVSAYRTTRSYVITVERGLVDRYPTLVVGAVTAVATLVGIVIKGLLDRAWGKTE